MERTDQSDVAETAKKVKVTPLMQFLHDRHSLKPEKKAVVVVPLKKVSFFPTCQFAAAIQLSVLAAETLSAVAVSSQSQLTANLTINIGYAAPCSTMQRPIELGYSACQSISSGNCTFVLLQKSGKATADLDLPPHLLKAASSKPPLAHQPSSSGKATVLPIPTSTNTHPSSSKSRKAQDQPPCTPQGKAGGEESPASSRPGTPSGKTSQDRQAAHRKAETSQAPSPAVVRKVVPIKLDKTPRPSDKQAAPSQPASRQSSDAAQQAAASSEAQVQHAGCFFPKLCICAKLDRLLPVARSNMCQHVSHIVQCCVYASVLHSLSQSAQALQVLKKQQLQCWG